MSRSENQTARRYGRTPLEGKRRQSVRTAIRRGNYDALESFSPRHSFLTGVVDA